jgi:DNA mismatch repair protein MutL
MDIKFSKMDELLDLVLNMIKNKLKNQSLIKDAYIEEFDNNSLIINDFDDSLEENSSIENTFIKEESSLNENTSIKEENLLNENTSFKNKYEEITLNLESIKEEETIYEKNPDNRLPLIYPVGLVHGTYIICQNEKGMYMIDQHAAKERINYELFKEKLNNPTKENIPMLLPLTIELSNDEYIILKENFDFLKNIGFEIEEFGINSIIIKAHPTWLTKDFEDIQIKKIIELVINKEKDFTLDKFNDHMSATLACKASIKANTDLSINEMEALISDLRKCKNPFNCPHGRPTIIYYSKYDLEKLFKRSGFESLK